MSRNHDNSRMVAQTEDVITCIRDLAKLGAQVTAIEIGRLPTPVVRVSRKPRGLESGVVKIEGSGNTRTETHAATHQHCQIEWRETA